MPDRRPHGNALGAAHGILFGLAPALRAVHGVQFSILKEGGRGASLGIRGSRSLRLLVAGEAAVCLMLLAGGGIKGGVVHGATDAIGFHAVENRHYVTDIHATVLRQLGLDSRRLEVPGRRRLDIDHGTPIREIIA